jgi:hypothetical protein
MLMLAAIVATPAMADDTDDLRSLRDTTIALVRMLVQQGVLTQEKADELIRKAEAAGHQAPAQANNSATPAAAAPVPGQAAPSAAPGQPPVVHVPYVPETVKQEIRDEVRQDVLAQAKQERWGEPGAYPDWLHRISFSGDVRFRFQADRYPTDNVPNASVLFFQSPFYGAYNINNDTEARNRLRLRARFGAEARVADTVTAALRLTTGTSGTGGDPSSENENLGNYNARGNVGFDRAYVSWRPYSWLYVTGGRLGNPFFAPTTLVWGDDLSLQGLVAGLSPAFGPVRTFATAGVFPIQDIEPTEFTSARSKWLFGYQGGVKWQVLPAFSWRVAAALYDYRRMQGVPNASVTDVSESATAAVFRQKGNSVFDINYLINTQNTSQNYLIGLASKFNEANASSSFDLVLLGNKHLVLDIDYVKNLGFDHAEIAGRAGQALGAPLAEEATGMQEKLTFGDLSFERRNAWQAYVGYRHVDADAVVDAFTDSDFHLGGTNATGYYLGGTYAFERNSTIGVRWLSAKQISGLPLAINVLQIDAIARF